MPLTDGFSSFAVADGKAFTLVTREVEGAKQEVCMALDAKTGKELWAMPLGIAKYDGGGDSGAPDNKGGDGPRSTPAYDHGKVYTYSSRMVLKCFDAETGKVDWSVDVIKDHAGRNIHWESAASPLIEGNLVLVAGGGPGEALLAFDEKDGHVVWKGEDDGLTQSTPIAATILGERQVIFFTQTGLVSVTPATGAVLWRFPFTFKDFDRHFAGRVRGHCVLLRGLRRGGGGVQARQGGRQVHGHRIVVAKGQCHSKSLGDAGGA